MKLYLNTEIAMCKDGKFLWFRNQRYCHCRNYEYLLYGFRVKSLK